MRTGRRDGRSGKRPLSDVTAGLSVLSLAVTTSFSKLQLLDLIMYPKVRFSTLCSYDSPQVAPTHPT